MKLNIVFCAACLLSFVSLVARKINLNRLNLYKVPTFMPSLISDSSEIPEQLR